MKAVFDAGNKEISKNGVDTSEGFIFPSYVEDIAREKLGLVAPNDRVFNIAD